MSTTLDEDMVSSILKFWVQSRKEIADQMRMVEHVRATKNN